MVVICLHEWKMVVSLPLSSTDRRKEKDNRVRLKAENGNVKTHQLTNLSTNQLTNQLETFSLSTRLLINLKTNHTININE